jgi:hypothetical protein
LLQIDSTRLLWQQSKSLPLGKVAWCDDLEVAPVKGGDLMQVEPLGKRYHAGIHGLKPLGHPGFLGDVIEREDRLYVSEVSLPPGTASACGDDGH